MTDLLYVLLGGLIYVSGAALTAYLAGKFTDMDASTGVPMAVLWPLGLPLVAFIQLLIAVGEAGRGGTGRFW